VRISFVGTKDKIEARVIPQKGFAFHTIWISGFHRRLTVENLLFPIKVVVSILQSFFLIRKIKPDVVVGTGGYVCGPILSVASLMHVPTVIHESNSYPGVTMRMVASRASKVLLTFESTKRWLPNVDARRIELLGNPTRNSLGTVSRKEGLKLFNLNPKKKTLLAFGGSLGATSINQLMERIAGDLTKKGIQIIWQTGAGDFERWESNKSKHVWVGKFIDKMEFAYAAADVVICRSGATTLAELTRLGKPAILVPYPHAAANHQELNAQAMVDAGAAMIIRDSELESKALLTIQYMVAKKNTLNAMHKTSLKLGKPNAGKEIAGRILLLSTTRTKIVN
ncbi:MAG TPA: undecaprenyldiphospho-muramoylpentapeptide beta-N-acetylglucosaminyltransferase, partial [Acidobacteriota bacterium]|nr:undecaprenyldiphospho-muramoylpentapeptide beta-N-acetylglucosaminyltransferase [Acidobacteriota bacterium]